MKSLNFLHSRKWFVIRMGILNFHSGLWKFPSYICIGVGILQNFFIFLSNYISSTKRNRKAFYFILLFFAHRNLYNVAPYYTCWYIGTHYSNENCVLKICQRTFIVTHNREPHRWKFVVPVICSLSIYSAAPFAANLHFFCFFFMSKNRV